MYLTRGKSSRVLPYARRKSACACLALLSSFTYMIASTMSGKLASLQHPSTTHSARRRQSQWSEGRRRSASHAPILARDDKLIVLSRMRSRLRGRHKRSQSAHVQTLPAWAVDHIHKPGGVEPLSRQHGHGISTAGRTREHCASHDSFRSPNHRRAAP